MSLEQQGNITSHGRILLMLIQDAGEDGINRKGLTDALHHQLGDEDYSQLELLEAQGLIISQRVDVPGHHDVETLYRAREDF
jgi:hypothetical protein